MARADTAAVPAAAMPEAPASSFLSLAAFRLLLVYIVVMFVQPQNRFTFLWPLHIADLSFMGAVGLHIMACVQERRPIMRFGPATIVSVLLLMFAMLSQYIGEFQVSSAWNSYIDIIVKNATLCILLEAMLTSVQRVMATQLVVLVSTLWWLKAGIRLAQAGATYSGDRLMGAAVGMIENPNSFAYFLCVFLPVYLWMSRHCRRRWERWAFLAGALADMYIVFKTGSRTGLLTLCVLAFFLLPHYGRHNLKNLALFVLAVAVLLPMSGERNIQRFKTIPQSVKSFLGLGQAEEREGPMNQDEQSADERARKNEHTWGLIKEHLLFGVGIRPDTSRYPSRWGMAKGEVHCEILMAGRQMGLIGMGLYVSYWAILLVGGGCIRWRNKQTWPSLADLGWTFQLQGVCLIAGGSFCPSAWNPPMMILAASASALLYLPAAEQNRTMHSNK
ncbi:MAG: O-antigen ligase family protein [Kiritimatiellae bacterium]|nr:O-antigen ligase family protein [Kiritimatiellia bacterium]MBR4253395.1 O-antigen ligase family protein [Kiritimatiellia bacterium]